MEEKVEFVYEPYKKVVIHEIVQYDIQMLVNLQGYGIEAGQLGNPLFWANGIAFYYRVLPPTEKIIKEMIRGTVHWNSLNFAFMPKHQPNFIIGGNVRIPIINFNNQKQFRDLAEWLKTTYKPK